MSSWVGYAVSVNCGEPLGCYQGTIVATDGSTITLTKAFRNGFPYPKSKVTLNAVDIKELKIIEETHGMLTEQTHSTVSVTKSNKKGQRATVCENLQANPSNLVNTGSPAASHVSSVQAGPGRSKPIDIQAPRGNKNITHSGRLRCGGTILLH
ncbi:PREDICTED: enhancer of mRNA-decapping protein 3 isoform X2 [Papilio polytes]|uniref:enhancer of mRNA-decapping protein 3 isoform X2 n=1 Tax=Papilio polytes TaxID=76194 RepID=UPI0006764D0C|nr:PREDICTED: enhancer of mRNA-decapping protein 3 isoform X2 [Papilio polytes]